MEKEKSAGAVIFRREEDETYYLLLRYPSGPRTKKPRNRAISQRDKDYWDLPKGHIEKGEQEARTVRREVFEETGLKDIRFVKGFRQTIKYFFKFKGETIFKMVVFYLAETKTKEIKISSEHIGYLWLPCREAVEQLTFENAKEIVKKANNYISGKGL